MTLTTRHDTEAFDEIWKERLTEQLLQFARTHAWGWLMRWNCTSSCPLNQQDLEDILSEVLIAVLRFRVPEGAKDWEPCLMAYIKRVAHRIYCRFRTRQQAEVSLEALPPHCQPLVLMDTACTPENAACFQAVAQGLMAMPRHHALAFLLHLDTDLAEAVLDAGGNDLAQHLTCPQVRRLVEQAPLRDREIAQLLGITPRAVIRARQHARERLRTYL